MADDASTDGEDVIFYPAVTSAHVTTLEFFGSLLLAGEGGHLCVYDSESRDLIHQQQVLKGNNVHGIRIDGEFELGRWMYICIFGGKSLRILNVCSPLASSILFEDVTTVFNFKDWIWDVIWISNDDNDDRSLVLAFGHNAVVFWDWRTGTEIRNVHCQETCILYSAVLLGNTSESLTIVGGTVFHDVIIWCAHGPSSIDSDRKKVIHRLQGHEGVIFCVAYNECLQLICSTSDDRSVRLWSVVIPSLTGSQLTCTDWEIATIHLKAVLYGHTARVWKAIPLGHCLVSAGEDSLLCIWDYRGVVIQKVHAHNGGKIWSVAVDDREAWVASGGSDAGIQLWPISQPALFNGRSPVLVPLPITAQSETDPTDFPRSVALLDINHLLVITNEGILYCFSDKTGEWSVLVNDTVYKSYSLVVPDPSGRYVALGSLSGQILIIDTGTNEGSFTAFQCVRQQIYSDKVLAINWLDQKHLLTCGTQGNMLLWHFFSSNGCLQLTLHSDFLLPDCKQRWISTALFLPHRSRVICGDRDGNVHVYVYDGRCMSSEKPVSVPCQSLNGIHAPSGVTDILEHGNLIYTAGRDGLIRIFTLRDMGLEESRNIKVTSLDWIARIIFIKDIMYILGFHRKEFVVWSWEQQCSIFSLPCGGGHRAWDFKMVEDGVRLVYIRGKEVLQCHIDNSFHIPFILRPSLHGRRICSLLHLFSITKDSKEVNICATASEDNTVKIIAFAYNKRSDLWHLICTLHGHISSVRSLATCRLRREKVIEQASPKDDKSKEEADKKSEEEEEQSVKKIEEEEEKEEAVKKSEEDKEAVKTSDEEEVVKTEEAVKIEEAVKKREEDDVIELLLFSAGGRAQLKVWKLTAGGSDDDLCHSQLLASHMLRGLRKLSRKPWKNRTELIDDPETRYMDFTVASICEVDESLPKCLYLAAGACSDGCIRIFGFNSDTKELKLLLVLTFHNHCVLRVRHFVVFNKLLLVSTATDGRVAFWNLSDVAVSLAQDFTEDSDGIILNNVFTVKNHSCRKILRETEHDSLDSGVSALVSQPFHTFHLHQSGINSLLVHEISSNNFLLVTGGDDNALHLIIFRVLQSSPNPDIRVTASGSQLSAHAAQITEIKCLPRNMLVSASIDQRINLWQWMLIDSEVKIQLLASRISSVADIATMAIWTDKEYGGQDFHTICVGGEGFQLFRCFLPNPQTERLI